MDSEVQRDGRILDLIDDAWREDKLPYEDVTIPLVSDSQNGAGGVPGRHPGKAEKPRRWLCPAWETWQLLSPAWCLLSSVSERAGMAGMAGVSPGLGTPTWGARSHPTYHSRQSTRW